ncbi:PAS domain-containing protein [Methylobacterium oryzae CBMB20]
MRISGGAAQVVRYIAICFKYSDILVGRIPDHHRGPGVSGAWTWVFAGGEQLWSPGFYRLLGLVPNAAKPSYELLLTLIHPEDRPLLPSLGDVRQGHVPRETVARVVRPNGTLRTLSLTMEVRFSAEGVPSPSTARPSTSATASIWPICGMRSAGGAGRSISPSALPPSRWASTASVSFPSRWRWSTACRSRRSASTPIA